MGQTYIQADRPLRISTGLGADALLATGLIGDEGLSQLFRYTIDAKTVRPKLLAFDQLLGQPVSVSLELPDKKLRYFHGICVRISQGESDADFTNYQLETVPKFWLLTKRVQSRIFQHMTVPDILKKVLSGVDIELQISGKFEPRDFCVQYRESDYNFASRLMEEEGIFYFHKHEASKHTMVLANTPQAHPSVVGRSNITYKTVGEGMLVDQDYITELTKVQEQTAGKYVLWDHTFELPHSHNESEKSIMDSVTVGKVSHKLKVGDNGKLEVYDWPGEYAQRFDGIDRTGSPQAPELQKISPDAKRTVELRMQEEAASAVRIQGTGAARQMTAGHKFTINTLPADLVTAPIKIDGEYVLTSVRHSVHVPSSYRSGTGGEGFSYGNSFSAIPAALPFRPSRSTPKPVVSGSQTAVVVGPPGEEIFTDKYGRIKVQFHWDREGKSNADSSCWVRVAQMAAGRGWGAVTIPRIGQEVVINFLEGDPDQPICVGSVFNPDQMPMYTLPDHKTRTYYRSNSSPGGVGYNALRIEDKAGQEQIYWHAQKDMDVRVRNDSKERVGVDRHLRVGFYLPNDHKGDTSGETKKGNQFEEVAIDHHSKIHRNKDEHIGGDSKLLIGGIDGPGNYDIHVQRAKTELIDDTSDLIVQKATTETLEDTFDQVIVGAVQQHYQATQDVQIDGQRTETIGGGADLTIVGDQKTQVGGGVSLTVGGTFDQTTGSSHAVTAGSTLTLQAGTTLVLEAGTITLKGGGGFITISPAGVAIQGTMVLINSGGAAVPGKAAKPKSPKAAKKARKAKKARDAQPIKPKDSDVSKTGAKSN